MSYKKELLSFGAPMESRQRLQQARTITSVAGLSSALGVNVFQLRLQCNFCCCLLNYFEKLHFDLYGLHLIFKDGRHFGICRACCRIIGTAEVLVFLDGTFSAAAVEDLLGLAFPSVTVRCYFCFRPLSRLEKQQIQSSGEEVYRVRNRWKSKCFLCR